MPKAEIAVVVDSTANLPANIADEHNIWVMPLRVIWPGDDVVGLKDIVEIEPADFFARLKDSKEFPTTAQPSPGEFVEFFTELGKSYKKIIAVLVSNELSGTFKSAQFALNMLEDLEIEIVDSKNTGMGLGLITLAASRAVSEGKSLKEVKEITEEAVGRTRSWFAVDTLDYLHRGGRVSGTRKWLGTILDMKPLLQVADGKLELFGTVRSMKKAVSTMLDLIEVETKTSKNVRLGISHAMDAELAEFAKKEIKKRMKSSSLITAEISPVIGAHTGPGAIGIAHLGD